MFSRIIDSLSNPRVGIPLATALGMIAVGGGTRYLSGSWMIAIAVALAFALVVLIFILLRTLGSEEREERLSGGLEDSRSQSAGAGTAATGGGGMLGIFSQALNEIRRSRLGAQGLFDLPWWITLGPTSSGKTELIRNAGFDVPAEFAHGLRSGPTAVCNFILSNQGIVIDTAGSFVDSGDETPEDWSTLLKLLKKHRRQGPLEGIVIALSAASLVSDDPGGLEETGRAIRRRLNELADALGFDVPIYVVVTQIDRIQGFNELISALPAERTREAFGWTNDRRSVADVAEAARSSITSILDQLDRILPELLLREPDLARRRNLFLLPQELAAVRDRVSDLLRSAFAPSVYDEVPFLRGVYFTSSMRGGATMSPVAQRLGHSWSTSVAQNSVAAGGIFSRGFFREIVIGDDQLAVETAGMGRRTRRVVVGLAAAVSITCLGLASVSFVENYLSVRDLETKTQRLLDAPSSLDAADALRESIRTSQSPEAALPVPFMGRARQLAVGHAKESFNWAMEREHIRPSKQRLTGILRRADHDAFEALAVLAMDVSWLSTRTEGDANYRPNLVQYTVYDANERDRNAFSSGYDAYVRWAPDSTVKRQIKDERNSVLESATSLLDLRRLEEWSEQRQDRQPPVRHSDFGLDVSGLVTAPTVPGAYTREGWDGLVRDLVKAVEDSGGTADENIVRFRTGYVSRFDRSWRDFLLSTPTIPRPSKNVFDSPHLAIFERLTTEAATDLPRDGSRPDWMSIAIGLRDESATPTAPREGEPPPPPPPWTRYKQALDQVGLDASAATPQTSDRALQIAVKMDAASSFTNALALLDELIPPRTETIESRKLRELLAMPILDAGAAILEASLPELNRSWYKGIYQPYGVEGRDPISLYNPSSGPLAVFLRDELAPFFERDEPKKMAGSLTLPVSREFARWLDRARSLQGSLFPGAGRAAEIPVRLEGIPSRVIGRSDVFVTRRDLRMECASSVQSYEYREGTSSASLLWRPDCTQVSLRIWIRPPGESARELRPRKEWNGPLALPRFFQEATRVSPGRYQWNLKYDGAEIRIEYRMRSGETLLGLVHQTPPRALKGQADGN